MAGFNRKYKIETFYVQCRRGAGWYRMRMPNEECLASCYINKSFNESGGGEERKENKFGCIQLMFYHLSTFFHLKIANGEHKAKLRDKQLNEKREREKWKAKVFARLSQNKRY